MPSDLFEWPTTNMEGRLMHEPMYDEDSELRDLLRTLSPQASEFFREALMRGQADPDHESARLLRYRDVNGPAWADLVDRLALDPELRRRCVRLLGELRT